MATKFSDFTAQAATAPAFVEGYDGTTNTQYSQTQLTDFVFGGTLGQSNTLTLGGYQINLSQGASGNYIQMNGPNANSSPVFIDGRRNGQTRAKFSLNSGSGRLELFHFGSTKYVDLNPGGLINYFLTNPGERPGNPTFGAGLRKFIFTQIDTQDINFMKQDIQQKLIDNFPNVIVQDLSIGREQQDENKVIINITYSVSQTNITDDLQLSFE